MSDYVRANTDGATHFADRDARSTNDPDKIVVGAHFDNEYEALVTAVNSKHDSDDFASQAEAEALSSETKLISPHSLNDVLVDNAGILKDLQALADPAANVLFGWDDTANAAEAIISGTNGGIDLSTVNEINVDLNDLVTETSIGASDFLAMVDITDSGSGKITRANLNNSLTLAALSDYDANDHIDHTGVTITAGAGMTGGGTIAATRTLNVIAGIGITVNANDVDFDPSGLTALTMPNFSQSQDGFVVHNNGVANKMAYASAGIKVATVTGATDTLATADMNTFIEYTDAAGGVTVTLNTGVGTVGNIVVIKQTGGSQVTIAGSATVEAAIGLKTRTTDSVITLVCIAANTWALYGDATA